MDSSESYFLAPDEVKRARYMHDAVRIVIVEDRDIDAVLVEREIKKTLPASICRRVMDEASYLALLEEFRPDVVVTDYYLPQFTGLRALHIANDQASFLPVIIITTAQNEDIAVECMKAGATDYVIKEHIKRLGQAVMHALEKKRLHSERLQIELALRTSESRFRGLYEHANIGIIRSTRDGQIQMANPAAVRMFGYDDSDAFARSFEGSSRWDANEQYPKALEQLVDEISVVTLECELPCQDGRTIFVQEIIWPVLNSDFQIEYYDSTLIDITEQKWAEEAQAQLESQLRQAQKMESIGLLAGSIAHDFNNLLTVITGYCNLIQEQLDPDSDTFDDMLQIQEASDKAATLTRQLLAFSRKQVLAPTVINLNELVRTMYQMFERLIAEDIEFRTVLQHDLPAIMADQNQIEQVIMNLVVNARDAMPSGGQLVIRTESVYLDPSYAQTHIDGLEGHCVLLSISDTGVGIAKENQTRIFEPFFTTKEMGKGTGLGLSMVYGIVKQSGGHITLSSEEGIGTTFRIYFPAREMPQQVQIHQPQIPLSARGGETILLVEDDEMIRQLVELVLQEEGYQVVSCSRGDEALERAKELGGEIQLLLTDVVVPKIRGHVLAAQIIAIQPDLRILYMSGYSDDVVMQYPTPDTHFAFLPKPFSPQDLLLKVREVLDT
jgi:two-component system cell cycle sensor histidine kinase/response regulator CckA